MRKCIDRIWWKGFKLFLRAHEVGEFEGIRFADFRTRGDGFLATVLESLRLIQTVDPRRFARVKKHIGWISNQAPIADANAEQYPEERWCAIDYFDPAPDTDRREWAAAWACVLVHEATHGVIGLKGIDYEGERRCQIERICVTEENRFARRLESIDPTLYGDLSREFDPSLWQKNWDAGPFQRARSFWKRHRQG